LTTEGCDDERTVLGARAVRALPAALAGGRLPHARFGHRGRGCPPGGLDPTGSAHEVSPGSDGPASHRPLLVRHTYDGSRRKDVTMNEQSWELEQFERYRPHLQAVAYRMLGSVTEAEDALQEAWIRPDLRMRSLLVQMGRRHIGRFWFVTPMTAHDGRM